MCRSGQAAGHLGMSAEMIECTYGHRNPKSMNAAAQAMTSKQQRNASLVRLQNGSAKRQKKLIFSWWRTQSLSNPSQRPNSLLTGKNTDFFMS